MLTPKDTYTYPGKLPQINGSSFSTDHTCTQELGKDVCNGGPAAGEVAGVVGNGIPKMDGGG